MADFDEQNKQANERNKKRRARELYDLRKVLERPEGRRLIWRVLELAGVFRISFHTNALNMSFNEGQRNLGLAIFEDIMKETPGSFTQMQKEYVSDLSIEEAEIKKTKGDDENDE